MTVGLSVANRALLLLHAEDGPLHLLPAAGRERTADSRRAPRHDLRVMRDILPATGLLTAGKAPLVNSRFSSIHSAIISEYE